MDYKITREDIDNFYNKKKPVSPQIAISKQMTVQNAVASRQPGQAPQGSPTAPTSDGFGRTV